MSQLSDIWTLIGIVFVAWFVLVAFFTPRIDYRISAPPTLDSDEFLRVIQATVQAALVPGNRIRILTNGSQLYVSMLDATRAARISVNLETYIFRHLIADSRRENSNPTLRRRSRHRIDKGLARSRPLDLVADPGSHLAEQP